jgi:hypothetical protein
MAKKVKTTKDGNGRSAYLSPVVACCAAYPVAMATNLAWGGNGVADMVIAAGSVTLTGLTHHTWHKRHRQTRLHATVFTGTVSGWVSLATVVGPYGSGMLNAWGLGSLFLVASWWLRITGFAVPHDNDRAASADDGMGLLAKGVEAVKGSRAKSVKVEEGQVTARVQLKQPNTSDDVQQEKSRIASNARVGTDQVAVRRVPGRADQADIVITASAQLDTRVTWGGPSQRGGSVADSPLVYGMRADGRPVGMWVCGAHGTATSEPRALGHALFTGMPNSGKTQSLRTLIMLGRWRRDFVPVVADPDKFAQGFGDIADTLALAATDRVQSRQMVRNLVDAINYRADLLGNLVRADGGTGYKMWVPECWELHGIPLLMVDFEEATTTLGGDNDDFDRAVRTARSTGIWIVASLQSAHGSNMERKSRGMFAQAVTHGCKEMYDAKFSLNPATLDAGADPTKWEANYPGSHYAELIGIPPEEWSTDARTFDISDAQLRAELDASRDAGLWAELDPGTKMRLGAGIPSLTDHAITARIPMVPIDMPDPEDEHDGPELIKETEDGPVDISQPLPPARTLGNLPQAAPMERISAEDAREALSMKIEELAADGFTEVRPPDFRDWVAEVGRSRQWVNGELKRLADAGVLEPGDGKALYRIRGRQGSVNGFAH